MNETAPARCDFMYERYSSLAEANIDMAFQTSTALLLGTIGFEWRSYNPRWNAGCPPRLGILRKCVSLFCECVVLLLP